MKIELKEALENLYKRWDTSGVVIVSQDNELIYEGCTGYGNREKNLMLQEDTKLNMDAYDELFIDLMVLHLIDNKKLSFSDTVQKYIPELKGSDKLTVDHLLKSESGLKDFYHDFMMVDFENDEEHNKLSVEERKRVEHAVRYNNRSFDKVMALIKDDPFKYKPGQTTVFSITVYVILTKIIEVVTGKNPVDYLIEDILKPNGIFGEKGLNHELQSCITYKKDQLISVENSTIDEGFFTLTKHELGKLLLAFSQKKFFSKSMWRKLLKLNSDNESYLFSAAGGYHITMFEYLGYSMFLYFNFESDIAILNYNVEQQKSKFENNDWAHFRPELRSLITEKTIQPKNTKMVKLSKKNFWQALDLGLKPGQEEFVLPAKESIGMSLVYQTKKGFVQMEGNIVTGLVVLNIDKKKEDYNIDIIIIDKKFQGKGYGKHMVNWAVDQLKEAGAQKLGIGVARDNIAAKKIYSKAGFVPKSVYSGGMHMEIDLTVDKK